MFADIICYWQNASILFGDRALSCINSSMRGFSWEINWSLPCCLLTWKFVWFHAEFIDVSHAADLFQKLPWSFFPDICTKGCFKVMEFSLSCFLLHCLNSSFSSEHRRKFHFDLIVCRLSFVSVRSDDFKSFLVIQLISSVPFSQVMRSGFSEFIFWLI